MAPLRDTSRLVTRIERGVRTAWRDTSSMARNSADLTDGGPPLIVVGSHRSGTSFVTDMLARAGWHVGNDVDENSEARPFIEINDWLLALAGATWQYPEPFAQLLDSPELAERVVKHMRGLMASTMMKRYHRGRRLTRPWLWKDPRNCFTLPLWLRVFPEARVLYVERHGVDVSASLQRRAAAAAAAVDVDVRRYRRLGEETPLKYLLVGVRPIRLERGLEMWDEYTSAARSALTPVPTHRRLALRYEGFGLEQEKISALLRGFLPEGSAPGPEFTWTGEPFSFRRSPDLLGFAARSERVLTSRGYAASGYAEGTDPAEIRWS